MANSEKALKRVRETILDEISSRFTRVRAGLDFGFCDAGVSQSLRLVRGGAWMTVERNSTLRDVVASALGTKSVLVCGPNCELPFEDRQFDVVVLAPGIVTPQTEAAVIPECHRVLLGGGHLIFSVPAAKRDGGSGYDERRIYDVLKKGFDVLAVNRPSWWRFGSAGDDVIVVARRKNWRSQNLRIVTDSTPVSDAMLYSRRV